MTTPDRPLRMELTFEMPGTAEQVWDAIATANGISSWFMPTDMEERVGGARPLPHGRGRVRGNHHRVRRTPPHRLRRARLGRPQRTQGRRSHAPRQRVHRRSPSRRHVRRARREQRVRNRRRLGAGVLRRDGAGLGAVLRPPASVPPALPGPAGHAAVRRGPSAGNRPKRRCTRCSRRSASRRPVSNSTREVSTRRSKRSRTSGCSCGSPGPSRATSRSSRGTSGDGKANANVAGYLFSEKASAYVEAERSNWKAWLDDLSVHTA